MPHDPKAGTAARPMLGKERRVIFRALFGNADAVLKADTVSTRNHYRVTDGNRTLEAMVEAGWMTKGRPDGEIDRLYHVTAMGALAAGLADRALPEHLALATPDDTPDPQTLAVRTHD